MKSKREKGEKSNQRTKTAREQKKKILCDKQKPKIH